MIAHESTIRRKITKKLKFNDYDTVSIILRSSSGYRVSKINIVDTKIVN